MNLAYYDGDPSDSSFERRRGHHIKLFRVPFIEFFRIPIIGRRDDTGADVLGLPE